MTNTTLGNTGSANDKLRSDIVRKIRLQRGVHDVFEDKTRTILVAQKLINVVMTAFITLIVFADFGLIGILLPQYSGQPVMIIVGVVSFVLFVMNAIADVFGISDQHTGHLRAIQLYADLLRDIKQSYYDSDDMAISTDMLQQFNDRYMQITFSSLNVGGRRFERGLAIYLRRRAIRLAIKENPFENWWERRKRAGKLVPVCLDREGQI